MSQRHFLIPLKNQYKHSEAPRCFGSCSTGQSGQRSSLWADFCINSWLPSEAEISFPGFRDKLHCHTHRFFGKFKLNFSQNHEQRLVRSHFLKLSNLNFFHFLHPENRLRASLSLFVFRFLPLQFLLSRAIWSEILSGRLSASVCRTVLGY